MSKISDNSISDAHIAPLDADEVALVEQALHDLNPLVEYIDLPWYKKLFRKRPSMGKKK